MTKQVKKTKKTKKPNKKLFAIVDDGNMNGDSPYNVGIQVKYEKGMSLEDIRNAYIAKRGKEEFWPDERARPDFEEIKKVFEEELGNVAKNIKVAWIVDAKSLKIIENSFPDDIRNDSECYAANRSAKALTRQLATKIIEE